ncbi:UDP-N-acetylmuramate dehydrogenase [Levilactobacillus bambusae]|uniref:UDP-N-acetylenolpyruvoylglucosamine reductase n=1 Tax=Levilactobacillus bambusae TaxID=2024736 RepID=A0A2V1MZE3_9LACO|nr:UDP-N-acetylmuramate dehydrogenase [Levilactobacillus bambusae]PWF99459.1 UDP-N-acetylmuramate dehydrogenase [Levilactobacillus bambusae]
MSTTIESAFPQINILTHEPLSTYTNTETGGPADFLAFPKSVAETRDLVDYATQHQLPITVIGNASNLIVRDGGIRGLTLILTDMNQVMAVGDSVTAEAGASLIETTKVAQHHALSGLEFAAGIPGSIGGAVFMNAGAYGGEMSFVIESVQVLTREGQIETRDNQALAFAYRHSSVQDDGAIVLSATFRLKKGNSEAIQAQMDDLNAQRAAKQPLDLPSCGSVFKRPVGYFAGKLIHDAGLQGFTSGGAQVSTKHAGFIVNVDRATATDYLNVIKHVQETVYAKFQVRLETEVRIIGAEA